MLLGRWIFSRLRRLLNVFERLENSPSEPSSDAHPPSSSTTGSMQGPRATPNVEEEAHPELLHEGVVYDAHPSYVCVYVSSSGEKAVAFTTDAFQPLVGMLLKFCLKHSVPWPVADSPEEIGVVENERLLDVYQAVYPRQEFRDAQAAESLAADDNVQQEDAPEITYMDPENWNFTATDKKATDLLGVAVAIAKGTTIFYTRLGTVEIPVETRLGVWVRLDVTLTEGRFVQGEDDVLSIEQLVPPPMETRIIRGKWVLLTAVVEKHPDGVANEYLGAVLDPLPLIPLDESYRLFVGELEFKNGWFHVVAYHKPATFGVPATVPQEESAYPFAQDQRAWDVQAEIIEYHELLQLQKDA